MGLALAGCPAEDDSGDSMGGRGSSSSTAALESYRLALSLKPKLLEDEEFAATFWDLLDDPRHRELSAAVAAELLGEEGHDRLARRPATGSVARSRLRGRTRTPTYSGRCRR